MLRFLFGLGLLILNIRASGQSGAVFPVQFDQFFQNYSLFHPAATGYEASLQTYLGHRALTGLFEGVNTSYAGVNYRIGRRDSLSGYHGIGANMLNDREGTYFNRGRLYISYAWHSRITYNWVLSGGAMIGLIDYVYKGSNVYAGGSSLKPTADVGLFLYRDNAHIGLTISQVIPGKLTPLQSQLPIKRFLIFSFDKTFYLSPYFSLMPATLIRITPVKNMSELNLYLLAKVQNVLMAGLQYKYQKGYSLMGGVKDVTVGKKKFSFFLSYYVPFTSGKDLKASRMEGTCLLGI